MASIVQRIKNLFTTETRAAPLGLGGDFGSRPSGRTQRSFSNERSIIASIYNRIAIDVAAVPISHVRLDEDKRYVGEVDSGLNYCLNVEANIDQAASFFRQDAAQTLCDIGMIALVPTDYVGDLFGDSDQFDVRTMRVGRVKRWWPDRVLVDVYDERDGKHKEVEIPKKRVALIENPLYTVMNEPNSTLQRLIRKLNLLDAIDEQSASGKLDIIIQLPYSVKSDTRRQQARERQEELQMQLKNSQYGVGYIDSTEKITQLNRAAENNLLKQVEYLTDMLYGQLGLTPEVFNGTADEKVMVNYHNRTIEPILRAFVEEMTRKYLSKTARTQGQAIKFYRDPFRNLTISDIGELADKLIRNEVAAANEIRGAIGWKPSKDPKADELRNPNVPEEKPQLGLEAPKVEPIELKQIR